MTRVLAALALGALPSVCFAQSQPAASFANLQPNGLPAIYVTDRAGHETRGQLVEITPATITILVAGAPRVFAPADVSLIEKRGDTLKNGAIAGLAAGIVLGVLSMAIADCPGSKDGCPGVRVVGVVIGAATYAAIGTAIDAAVVGRTRIWPIKDSSKNANGPLATASPAERRLFIGWRIAR